MLPIGLYERLGEKRNEKRLEKQASWRRGKLGLHAGKHVENSAVNVRHQFSAFGGEPWCGLP